MCGFLVVVVVWLVIDGAIEHLLDSETHNCDRCLHTTRNVLHGCLSGLGRADFPCLTNSLLAQVRNPRFGGQCSQRHELWPRRESAGNPAFEPVTKMKTQHQESIYSSPNLPCDQAHPETMLQMQGVVTDASHPLSCCPAPLSLTCSLSKRSPPSRWGPAAH
jgi:hypothetical protein